jgi:DNA polymerase III alpha subunit/nucleotidyltransferase/DNA polymerase involved in DNA repair
VPQVSHLDADAFFASVEQAADPRLRGKPVAVGGEKRGIIASASYEARKFGVYTPMPTVRARKLCPRLVVLPGDYEKYERFSRWMFSYAFDFTPNVEICSIDEGYFDLRGVRRPPVEVADVIRRAIREALKITVSEGIGANKLVSQIASKLNKPAAFLSVPAGGETGFLHPLANQWLPGVGPKTSNLLNAAGLARIGQIAATPVELLELLVGSAAPTLNRFARGLDDRPVIPLREPAKSYSQQETFAQDQTDEAFLEATLRRMADHLMVQARADGKSVRTLTVKVRYNDMAEDQRSESLDEPTDLETDVYGRLRELLRQAWKRRVSLRMVSLKFANLYEGFVRTELPLERAAQQHDARRRLARVIDELRRSRGRYVLMRGHDLVLRDAASQAPSIKQQAVSGPRTPSSGFQLPTSITPHSALRIPHSIVPHSSAPRSAFRTPRSMVSLVVRSHYSFLSSTLSPAAIVALAQQHGLPAIALCDQGNLHGAVEFVQAAKEAGIRPILGVEVRMEGRPLWLYVENARGYANLCRLLSPKAEALRRSGDSVERRHLSPGQSAALCRDAATRAPTSRPSSFCLHSSALEDTEGLLAVSRDAKWAGRFPGRFYLAMSSPDDLRRVPGADRWPCVAIRPVHYATPADRAKFDIVQSIRTLTLLKQAHPHKLSGGEFHFRPPREIAEQFQHCLGLLERTQEIAERCAGFEFPLGPPQFPAFQPPDGSSPRAFLRKLVFDGLRRRYPESQQADRRAQVETELQIIHDVGYEEYFLVVWGLLQECRRRGIDWITRGSAADSLVCYCLGISSVCPVRFDLYFRRFLNRERMALHKLPDIDVDFPHDRKDDVIDLMFEQYGADHCAVVGGFSTFQARSAFAEVAKVLGVAERDVRRFTEHFPWHFGMSAEHLNAECGVRNAELGSAHSPLATRHSTLESGTSHLAPRTSHLERSGLAELLRASPECGDLPLDEEPYRTAVDMAAMLDGVPRYPKMHPCGVVLSRQPMSELTPTFISGKGYPTTHFDMDAVEAIGLVKIDILAQGGLAVMRDVKALLAGRGIDVDLQECGMRNAECGIRRPDAKGRRPNPLTPALSPSDGERVIPQLRDRVRGLPIPNYVLADSPTSDLCLPTSNVPHSALRIPHSNVPHSAFRIPHYDDPLVWELIASGNARAVHHIESPAMISLCRMTNVREIDGLIAIVSVIRPGAANERKKVTFTRRYQGREAPTYPHPSLEPCLRSTFGLVVYEEHILQICEAFAGLDGGRADVLRRALVKQKWRPVEEIGREFAAAARARGHDDAKIAEVWELVTGFNGYAFCKAHSTAYGVEAYQSAWLKRYFPAEFMAAVLSNGKGFYRPLVYVLECWRLGLAMLPPSVNAPGPAFGVETGSAGVSGEWRVTSDECPGSAFRTPPSAFECSALRVPRSEFSNSAFRIPHSAFPQSIRVPVTRVKGLTERTAERLLRERARSPFASVRDFYFRVAPLPEEMEALIRVGAFDELGQPRTQQVWEYRRAHAAFGHGTDPDQGWLFECGMRNAECGMEPPGGMLALGPKSAIGVPHSALRIPHLTEPSRHQRLLWEAELLGFPASGHPLELHADVAWESYCPVARLGEHIGEEVVTCGLVIEERVHHQATGEPMKFLTLCDWTGMVETELFAATYKSYGLATVRYPVLELTARVEAFENGRGFTLRVLRAGKPRKRAAPEPNRSPPTAQVDSFK